MGKIIGFFAGILLAKSIWAGIFFAILGHVFFDKKRNQASPENREKLARVQAVFFETVFKLLGYLAKADGRINEHEIDLTQGLMNRMGLSADHKREAIRFFQEGANAEFELEPLLAQFREVCGRRINLRNMVLVYMVELALADGALGEIERSILQRVGEGLGYPTKVVEQIIRMLVAQAGFQRNYQQNNYGGASGVGNNSPEQLKNAYDALGVSSEATDSELKRAYRKLMSQYHPDKLMGQGLPDDMVKSATERSQEVQSAYDIIKKQRRIK